MDEGGTRKKGDGANAKELVGSQIKCLLNANVFSKWGVGAQLKGVNSEVVGD